MNARIYLVVSLLLAMCLGARAADCDGEDQSKAPQVAQKLDLLARLLDDSEPVRRAQREGNEAALANNCPLRKNKRRQRLQRLRRRASRWLKRVQRSMAGASRTPPVSPLPVSSWPQQRFASRRIRQRNKHAKLMKERCNSRRASCYLSKHSLKTCAD